MPPDSIPQLSLGTAALIIFAVCAAYLMLRGMSRMLVGVGILCASLWAGFHTWQIAPALAIQWTGAPEPWISMALPFAAFIAVFLILRTIARFVIRPFNPSRDAPTSRPRRGLFKTALLAAVPAAILWLTGATILHHIGAVSQIRSSAETSPDAEPSPAARWIQDIKESVEAIVPTRLLSWLDPLTEPSRLAVAKLITSRDAPAPIINPETGQPYPRAVLVDDPELQDLARDGRFSTLLRHPLISEAAKDPRIHQLIESLQLPTD